MLGFGCKRLVLLRDQCAEPIFVRQPDPAAIAAGRGNIFTFFDLLEVQLLKLAIENADNAQMDKPPIPTGTGRGRFEELAVIAMSANGAIGAQLARRRAKIGQRVGHGEHEIIVEADLALNAHAAGFDLQGDRRRRGQLLAGHQSPLIVKAGKLGAFFGEPVPACIIAMLGGFRAQ